MKKVRFGYGIALILLAIISFTGCPKPTEPAQPTAIDIYENGLTNPVSCSIMVIESVNGTKLPSTTVSIYKTTGELLVSYSTNSTGSATIKIESGTTVNIVTEKSGYASTRVQNYVPDPTKTLYIVNQKLGMVTKPASAPMLTALEMYNDDFSAHAAITDTVDLTTYTYLVAEFTSDNAIEATAWSGFGAKLGIDINPDTFNGIQGGLGNQYKDNGKYVSTFVFPISNKEITAGTHIFNIAAYDVANNRLQMSIPLTVIPTTFTGNAIPGTAAFSAVTVDLRAFPLSRGYFGKKNDVTINALNQYLGNDISYRAAVSFKLLDGTNNVAIRGFDVYRSTDGTNWTKVGTVNYGALSTGSSGTHTYYDTDSALEADTTYYYKIRAFTDSANYKESDGTARAKLMAPFQANLSAPLNQTSFDYNPADMSGIPNFVFTISNTSLWNSAESDYFYFFLTIKEKSGDWKYIGRFRYNFSGSRFECKVGANWYSLISLGLDSTDIAYSAGTITIKAAVLLNGYSNAATGAAIEFEEGVTYEWDIYGDLQVLNGSSDHPAYFQKSYTGGVSRSYADVYSTGANTINGAFEFYVY